MIAERIGQSLSAGNEPRDYWSCEAAETHGSQNYAGICSPAIDALVEQLVRALTREALVTRTRALLWAFYVVPHWYAGSFRLVSWDKFGQPSCTPPYGLAPDTGWMVAERARTVE